jgi:hypothetical protein
VGRPRRARFARVEQTLTLNPDYRFIVLGYGTSDDGLFIASW